MDKGKSMFPPPIRSTSPSWSPKFPDQARPLLGRACTVHDLFPTESAGVWSSSDQV